MSANDIIEKAKEFFKAKDKKRVILICAAFLGILLIMLSEMNFNSDKKNSDYDYNESEDYASYVRGLNEELTAIISSIEGAGNCKVMITLKNTREKVYAENSEITKSESSNSQNNEYVIYDSENGDSPILLKENFPVIEGVAIVCSGGDNILIREKITNCVCALFDIPSSRVSVSKLNVKGDINE